MPKFNRRRFLQVASAAGLAPALPATVPARAAVATGSATHAQMLWASLYARAGSTAKFVRATRTMGLSNKAAQGVCANLLRSPALAAHSATSIGQATRPASTPFKTRTGANPARSIREGFERLLADEPDDAQEQLVETEETTVVKD